MNKYVLIVCLQFIFFNVFSQNTILKGLIKNLKTGEPLLGATVNINNAAYGTVSDFDGLYDISLPYGNYKIVYSYVGYENFEIELNLNSSEYSQNVDLKEITQDLKTVVISASRYQKDSKEETVSMEVIPKTFVTNNNPKSMDDAMQRVPGVTIIDGQANIRAGSGFTYGAGSRVMILTDGLPLLTADAGDAKWNFVPIENLEQVEVIKGAASAVYGSSAMNGIINLRTAYPTSKPETKITAFVHAVQSPGDTARNWWKNTDRTPSDQGINFSHKQKFGQFDLVTGGNFTNSASFRKNADETRIRFNVNTRYRFKKVEGLSAGLNTNFQTGKGGTFFIWSDQNAGAYVASSLGGSNVNNATRFTIDPFVDYFTKKGDKFSFKNRYFYTVNNTNQDNQDSYATLIYNEFTHYHPFKKLNMNLVSGAVATFSEVKSDLYQDHSGKNFAGFVQLDKKFEEIKLNVSGGFRYEYFNVDTIEGQTQPLFRAGINKQFGKGTFLRASWGQGYRFPSIAELYVNTSAGGLNILPNPELRPEKGWNAEIGVSQGIVLDNWESVFNFAVYWQEYTDMMEFTFQFTPSFGFKSLNVGNTRVAGTEFSALGQAKIGKVKIQYLGGINYALPMKKYDINADGDTVYNSTGDYINAFFRNVLKTQEEDLSNIMFFRNLRTAKVDVQGTYGKFSLGLGMNYLSLMERINGELLAAIPDVEEYMLEHKKGDIVFESRLVYDMNENIRISFITKNLANRFYYIRPALAESPRNFTLMLNYIF